MLYIYRRVNINPIVKQLIYILVPLLMAASFSIGMRQFIDENQLRLSRYGAVEISRPFSSWEVCGRACGST